MPSSLQSQILEISDRLDSLKTQPLAAFEAFAPDDASADFRIPLAENVEIVFTEQLLGTTNIGVRWNTPPNANIDHFEFWVQHPGLTGEAPFFVTAAKRSPALVTIAADENSTAIVFLRTFMKSGLSSNILQSPTVTATVEVGNVALDRFSWINPTDGNGSKPLDIGAITSGNSSTVTVVNHSGAGRFISFGVAMYDVTAVAGSCDLWVDITIDGGTKQSYQIIFASRLFGDTILPWSVASSSAPHGDSDDDSIMVPVNITYNTSLLVELRTTVGSNFTGNYKAVAVVHRAELTS